MPEPKFKVGQKVRITIPRDDFDYKYDGKIGLIEKVVTLSSDPEYTLQFSGGVISGIHFLEQDLEAYSEKEEEKSDETS